MTAGRPRLAFVGPLPPQRSGIADYAADLLPRLAGFFEVEAFVRDDHPGLASGRFGDFALRPALSLDPSRFDAVVYQMGNNPHHDFLLDLAARRPGILLLHDLVLHHLYEEQAVVLDDWVRYGECLRESYGETGAAVLRWKRWRLASEGENFLFPLFEPLAVRSRGVLVHSHGAARHVARRLPGVPVRRIAMGIPLEAPVGRGAARARLGLGEDEVVVGVFGFLTPIKRLHVIAPALRRAREQAPQLRLVLVGEAADGLDLGALFTSDELAGGGVTHLGYVPRETYRDWMAAADVAVNLRYPTAGETSASLLRLLGEGKCALVSAYGQFLEIPPDAVVRIPVGTGEVEALAAELTALARDPARRARLGERARAFIVAGHSMARAAEGFAAAVKEILATPAAPVCPVATWRQTRTSRTSTIEGTARFAEPAVPDLLPRLGWEVELVVHNAGEADWIAAPESAGGDVAVAADIVTPAGDVVAHARPARLAADVPPGGEEVVRLIFVAPAEPGEYRIQPMLLHFGRGLVAGGPIPFRVRAAQKGEETADERR